jgi:inward rectifier potassium channel
MNEKIESADGNVPKDLGLGIGAAGSNQRMINPDGSFNVRRNGQSFFERFHFYHFLLNISWLRFHLVVLAFYFVVNCVFALLYWWVGLEQLGGLEQTTSNGRLLEAFFFSAQSLTTVGYGRIAPVGLAAGLLATIESLVGLMSFALITGILYGKFTRPNVRILFSTHAVMGPFQKKNAFMFRCVNARENQLIETEVQVVMAINQPAGETVRRMFFSLALERDKINFFPLPWTIVHPIDEKSPLFGLNAEDLESRKAEVFILLKAFDDNFHQQVYARYSYTWKDFLWGQKFFVIHHVSNDGTTEIDMKKFNQTELAPLNNTTRKPAASV